MKKILTLAAVALMQCGTASAQVDVSAEIGHPSTDALHPLTNKVI